ncbi:hypothetical protein ELG72_37645 [Rhizobium leguminosarum]|uniref:hypothetical protein n=1 Tax=Rhizobium TaxID=379 RepID=UPI0010300684|nr:hypothetical protein [Rhizobium leguminosarum]TBF87887.1 hypothetical protein ELG82_37455 [Rhizobium leguminosarum]TBG07132.1 hypothetical protein ELG80_37240 [Rhizobium leguminosarum]TBG07696.1 hypothetical protein ELG81_37545 [Rhizobium leguminosarum]TBG30816.1 hypothetical protein ELG75_36940 [Rhizobium leguminosarum]TBG50062.1 hypothetical protein ELG72_37645 [Rhizobium leguminosarum]
MSTDGDHHEASMPDTTRGKHRVQDSIVSVDEAILGLKINSHGHKLVPQDDIDYFGLKQGAVWDELTPEFQDKIISRRVAELKSRQQDRVEVGQARESGTTLAAGLSPSPPRFAVDPRNPSIYHMDPVDLAFKKRATRFFSKGLSFGQRIKALRGMPYSLNAEKRHAIYETPTVREKMQKSLRHAASATTETLSRTFKRSRKPLAGALDRGSDDRWSMDSPRADSLPVGVNRRGSEWDLQKGPSASAPVLHQRSGVADGASSHSNEDKTSEKDYWHGLIPHQASSSAKRSSSTSLAAGQKKPRLGR